jgi:hypothetical protein
MFVLRSPHRLACDLSEIATVQRRRQTPGHRAWTLLDMGRLTESKNANSAMQTLRRLFALTPWNRFSRLSARQLLVLFLVAIVPGGLVVPLCCGIYGALRYTLSGKAASRGADAPLAVAEAEAPSR